MAINFLERKDKYPEEKKLAWEKGEKCCPNCIEADGFSEAVGCGNRQCPCHSEQKKALDDCSGCTDRHSEGTHQMHTKQHPCPEGGDPNCGYCFPEEHKEGEKKCTCCDGECNHDNCCGKIPENCNCECHSEHKKEGWLLPGAGAGYRLPEEHKKESSGWEERFDEKFPDLLAFEPNRDLSDISHEVRSFIASELHSRDTALLALIDGMKKEVIDGDIPAAVSVHMWEMRELDRSYNSALSDLKEAYRKGVIKTL